MASPLSRPPADSPRQLPRAARLLRAGTVAAAAAVLALAAGGCAQFDATFGQQEAVVHFQPGTSLATRLHVRAACSHVQQATPEPLPTDHLVSDQVNDVRYQVGGASDAQLAELETCVGKFRSVAGVDIVTPGGS